MAKRKRQSGKGFFSFSTRQSKSRTKITAKAVFFQAAQVFVIIFIFAGVAVGFVALNNYVESTSPSSGRTAGIELANPPAWLNETLKQRICSAAKADGELVISEGLAKKVQQNLQQKVVWLDDITVQTTDESVRIFARWRKPLAMVKRGVEKFYIDRELVVLDYLDIPELAVVKIDGLHSTKAPAAGEVWRQDDLAAGIALLEKLEIMDASITPDKPLMNHIDRIDVSNFNGRESGKLSHIILYTKNNTEIIWGAEIGTWQRNLEVPDEEKLAKLYAHYNIGEKWNEVKYINLRDPQNNVIQPIDKY